MEIRESLFRSIRYAENHDFAGWDPYDALNSPLIRVLTGGTKIGRMGWTQLMRRSPVNLRPLLGVPIGHNPKGLGLFLEGCCRMVSRGVIPAAESPVDRLLDLLEQSVSGGFAGNCWGYNFDWQSRAAFVPKGTPTIVNSAFIGHALLDCHALVGSQRALDLARSIPDFITTHLRRKREGDRFCFSYTPGDENFVHNANMLGASLLMRMATLTGDTRHVDDACRAMAYSLRHQHEDGSWAYAETPFQSWIDSFHTGFNLEALRWFIRCHAPLEVRAAYDRGRAFYADRFFLPDGTPKYYHDHIGALDIHAPAEAVVFFSAEREYRALAERELAWMMGHLWDDFEGRFYYRLGKRGPNRIPYMRWAHAWGFRAVCHFLFEAESPTDVWANPRQPGEND